MRCIAILHRPSLRKSAAEHAASSSHLTPRWRKPDSNSRSHPDGERANRVIYGVEAHAEGAAVQAVVFCSPVRPAIPWNLGRIRFWPVPACGAPRAPRRAAGNIRNAPARHRPGGRARAGAVSCTLMRSTARRGRSTNPTHPRKKVRFDANSVLSNRNSLAERGPVSSGWWPRVGGQGSLPRAASAAQNGPGLRPNRSRSWTCARARYHQR